MKIYALLLGLLVTVSATGQQLVLKSYTNTHEIETLTAPGSVSVHHAGRDFIIATAYDKLPSGAISLRNDPWNSDAGYFLVWLPEDNSRAALNQLADQYKLLYSDAGKAIVEVKSLSQPIPKPYVHGGIVRISALSSWEPGLVEDSKYVIDTFPAIYGLMAMVDTGEFMPSIRHLEEYGTRFCESPQAVEAQNWIKAKFEEYPELDVELQAFPYWYCTSSDNVIAKLTGKVDPDQ